MASTTQKLSEAKLGQRYLDLVRSLITILELRNPYNIDHCRLVARLCEQMAKKAGFDKESRTLVCTAAELHTLGVSLAMEEKKPYFSLPITKLGLSSGRDYPSHERELQILQEVMGGIPGLEDCISVILDRNEWYDGSASLFGKKGEEISPEARLLGVADAFIDQCTPKKHRAQVSSREALRRIFDRSGTQFDPRFVEALQAVTAEEDDGAYKESGRTEHFETSRCRHYLNLGHLYIAIHETDWALRSYLKAEKIAVEMADSGLELGAISGQVMVYCDRRQLEQAREALQRARQRTHSEREKHGYHLMWGLLEWLSGREKNGQEILEGLISHYRKARNLPGLIASLTFQSYLLLTHRGLNDEEHVETLTEFMGLVARYDMFDVVERYRKFTLPLFLSAVLKGIEDPTARANLTKMGEPCQQALLEHLAELAPSQWMDHMLPEPVVPSAQAPLSDATRARTQGTASEDAVFIQTLGRIRLRAGGEEVAEDDWPTQKALRLFAHLAVTRSAITDGYLMETLWPDAPESKARNSLRNAIHQVRTVLKKLGDGGGEMLQRGRKSGTASLDFEYILDIERLDQYLREATEAQEAGNVEQAIEKAKLALDLYQGEFMEGFHDDWVDGLRVQYRELQQRALGALGRAYLGAGRYEEAEVAARRMLAADDLREEAHEVTIRALAGDGRSAEAIRHYEETVDLFEREIGVSPSSLTAVLQETGLLL
jgi:DNA-binding SARP family transcriptional activator